MSNFLAVATVTETLHQLLQAAVNTDLPGGSVTMSRPQNTAVGPGGPTVNIFLYEVTQNAALRNADLPTRRASGLLQERPVAAIDLHYIFSFSGDESQLEPQRLLGTTVRTLHGRPILTRQMLADALASTTLGFLAASDLPQQVELVKLTPSALTLQDLSNLWSVFFETPYLLSVAYEASVVLIEDRQTALAALPVHERNLQVLPFRQPLVESVRSAAGPNVPIVAGDTILIRGQRLQGDVTLVRIGGNIVTPASVSDTEISLPLTSPPLPAAALRSGIHGVQVLHQVQFGTPADPHRGFESNVFPFVWHPKATNPSHVGPIVSVDVDPPVRIGQRVILLLNETAALDPAAFSFTAPVATADASTVHVTTTGVTNGVYFVRLQVDGAESPLDLDPTSLSFGPTLAIP
jgi:hypothetical protein